MTIFLITQSTRILGILVGVIFAILGLLMVARFIYDRVTCKEKVEATIIRRQKAITNGVSRSYTEIPIVSYKINGERFETTLSDKNNQYELNSKINIYVNKNNPKRFYVEKNYFLIVKAGITFLVGVACILIVGFL